jgi:hypothetical protein
MIHVDDMVIMGMMITVCEATKDNPVRELSLALTLTLTRKANLLLLLIIAQTERWIHPRLIERKHAAALQLRQSRVVRRHGWRHVVYYGAVPRTRLVRLLRLRISIRFVVRL